jgi:hypothetical protein
MNITINPFQQLYLSDDIQNEDSFVELFSKEVLQTAINPVFQGANVVLSGTQGCGKTMILTLLRPEIRLAYWNTGNADRFPINPDIRNFVSAGINLTRSSITDLVEVSLGEGSESDLRELPYYFADFFNFLVVADLIRSVEIIGENPNAFDGIVNLSSIDQFVAKISQEDCWFGALRGINSLKGLKTRIAKRIDFYRRWSNGNLDVNELARNIRRSKTNIGEPIARMADALRQTRIIKKDTPVLIRVDQIEEMHRAFTERKRTLLLSFRMMLNKAFAARDARVHYRAGSRRYGWNNPDYLGIWGSEGRLENKRDYILIDMDQELFALGEQRNSVFEKLAIDAFQKRVEYYLRGDLMGRKLRPKLAKSVFGKHPVAEERLIQLSLDTTEKQIDRALALDLAEERGRWSSEWKSFLRKLYRKGHEGMLDAVLAAAWGRQTGGRQFQSEHRELPPPPNAPWRTRKWWRKERLDQAILQLSTRCQQRFMWWGFDDIRSLSGGNITVFLHICHRVWDGFLKSQSGMPESKRTDLLNGGTIDHNIQAAGITFASNDWFKKLPEEPSGDSRQNFAEKLGLRLNQDMLRDLPMSYPGGNGISIKWPEKSDEDIELLKDFLHDAVGYGTLFEAEHTSKSKRGGRRNKYYINPILCPRFQLPEARTKEPYYWKVDDLFDLVAKARITLGKGKRNRSEYSTQQPKLPGFEDKIHDL